MKYKIEIWQHQDITEIYESDDIEDVLKWYKLYWWWLYELGDCSFTVYKDNRELSWNEEYKLGFYK